MAHQMVERLVNLGAQFTRDPETARAGRRLLEETLDFYAGVLRLDSEDPGIRFATSNAYLRVGQIQNELGRWSEARTALNRAAEIYTSLRDEFPDNPEYGFWLVESHFQRGYAFRGSREIREAAEAFGQAVHVGEELVARYPDVLKYKSLLSISLINWRTCVSRNTPEAEQALRRAVAIQEEVVRADPQGVWPLQDLAQGKDNLAHEERRLGNLDAAERLMHQAIEVRQRVQAIQPTDPMHQFYLARGYHHLAQLCDAQQRYDDAEKYHQLAINEVTTLCEQKKQALNFRKLQIDCELARMRHYHQADNVEAWVNCFESVMCYYHAVMAEWPEDPSHATAALRQLDLALDWCQQLDEEAVVARVQQVARQTVAKVRENDRQLSSSEETRGNDTATEQSILLNRRLAHAAHRVGDLPTAVRALSKSVTADAARLLQSTSLRLPKMVGAPAPEHGNP